MFHYFPIFSFCRRVLISIFIYFSFRFLSSISVPHACIVGTCRLPHWQGELSADVPEEDMPVLPPAAELARPVQAHPRHAQEQVWIRQLQGLREAVQEQEQPRLPHVEVPQGQQGQQAGVGVGISRRGQRFDDEGGGGGRGAVAGAAAGPSSSSVALATAAAAAAAAS